MAMIMVIPFVIIRIGLPIAILTSSVVITMSRSIIIVIVCSSIMAETRSSIIVVVCLAIIIVACSLV